MASFDIITATGKSYITSWEKRNYILKLALAPVLIKLFCYVLALTFSGEDNLLRLSLFLIPAYIAEGWMLAHLVRMVFLNQYWPFQPTGDEEKDEANLMDRARGILSAMICFALLNLAVSGFITGIFQFYPIDPSMPPEDVKASMIIFTLFMFAFMVWAFRFLWIFIPLALNYPVIDFLKKLGGYKSSFYILGAWILCFLPPVLLMQVSTSLILSASATDTVPPFASFLIVVLRVVFDTLKSILCTLAICYGLKEMFQMQEKET